MPGGLYSRIKTWTSTEDVTNTDLNAEFDNVLNNFIPTMMDDYSANVSQMQTTVDPGEVGSESQATSLAGELARLRHIISEITGEDEWYESPSNSLLGLASAVGTGVPDNRLVSGRMRSTSDQPTFLVPHGAARTVTLKGATVNFLYYVNGTEYRVDSDITITSLTAAPSSNNTCLVNDAALADQDSTKYLGEDGTEITIDTVGSEITALVGKTAAFKIDNGSATEYFIAEVGTNKLFKARRGYFFDESDNPKPRIVFSNNDTITLLKLSWIFAKTDESLTVTYNPPTWSKDEPSSPSTNDYWFDYVNETWKKYDVSAWVSAGAIPVGICVQDTTNCIGARSFEFFKNYNELNSIEVTADTNSQVKSRWIGSQISVWGIAYRNDYNLHTWDMANDLASGVTEAASTRYFFYITEDGDKIIDNVGPHDRREDLLGYYHPHQSWRCVGSAYNNGSSNLTGIKSYHKRYPDLILPGMMATYGGTSDPTGWLICDGREVDRVAYADLFNVIGESYGQGDNSTTFNIPDRRGYFVRGNAGWYTQNFATSDVDTGDDIITWTSGKINRTGFPVRFTSSGTLPAGLSLTTTYYAIYVTANTFKVATSYANALAGTQVNITDVGSGTHTIVNWSDPDVNSRVAPSVGGNTGVSVGGVQEDAFQAHQHNDSSGNNTRNGTNGSDFSCWSTSSPSSSVTYATDTTIAEGDYGSPRSSFETRPRNAGDHYIIKY